MDDDQLLPYIDTVAPTHERLSCTDTSPCNSRYAPDDFGGCYRCTLLAARRQGIEEAAQFILTHPKKNSPRAKLVKDLLEIP
jgi:hypothetical protein